MQSESFCGSFTYHGKTPTKRDRDYSSLDFGSACGSITLPYNMSAEIEETIKLTHQFFMDSYEYSSANMLSKSLLGDNCCALSHAFQHYLINDKESNYEGLQLALAKLNEKQESRKDNGVYYTPSDVVYFIVSNCIRATYGLINGDNLASSDFTGIPVRSFCLEKTVFEPTCGAGEFLLSALEIKLELWEGSGFAFEADTLEQIVATLHGNDINRESTTIAKIRLFLLIIRKCGIELACSIADVLDAVFTNFDFINIPKTFNRKYDIIIGNPPYVEDSKYSGLLNEKYGNVYCNVLSNSIMHLSDEGVIGFIIPISYVSTPRMRKIREKLNRLLPKQFILNFADRPDCLFTSVHQKLSILIGCPGSVKTTYTSNYHYWYKAERDNLFKRIAVVENEVQREDCIPKFGTYQDKNIYNKITDTDRCISVYDS